MSSPEYSYQPASAAMFGNSRADRKRSISSSGLTPGSRRRKTFSTSSSPKTTDELDCSAPIGRMWPVGVTPPWNETPSIAASPPSSAPSTSTAPGSPGSSW